MSYPRTPAEGRDDRAADRDDAADLRDDSAYDRDTAATQRDADASERDTAARRDSADLADRFRRIGQQILDHLTRIENATLDPADWLDLTPTALARLEAHTTEQRRLAGLDRAAITTLLDDLRHALDELGVDRHAAASNRHEASRDRHHSAGNRRDSGRDRDAAAQNRAQAAIEREQVDPRDLPPRTASGPTRPESPAPPSAWDRIP